MPRLATSSYCWAHDPARGRERAAARKLGGSRGRTPTGSVPSEPVRLRDVGSIQERLEAVVLDTLHQRNSAQRSRTLGYLLGFALRALEVGELEQRLAGIEERLKRQQLQIA